MSYAGSSRMWRDYGALKSRWYPKRVKSSVKAKTVRRGQVKSIVRNMLHPERKFFDQFLAATTLSSQTMHVISTGYLNDVDQGDTNITRQGNVIAGKSLELNYTLALHASGTVDAFVRVVVVLDRLNDSSTAIAANNVFETHTIQRYDALSLYDKKARYKILYDAMHLIPILERSTCYKTVRIPLPKSLKCTFTGAAGTNYGKNGISMFVGTSVSSNLPNIAMNSRFIFTDV